MNLRHSPLAKSPPKMAHIAGVTKGTSAQNGQKANLTKKGNADYQYTLAQFWLTLFTDTQGEDDAQFDMDF